ncbi:hypothetical protein HPC49_01265 [Pyxidicoccus fallax]|uniref:Lipoprotein n=1 Tax=Pyxidicoccus fallax TaxID=394095 RepID=A0A848L4N7_9BACT|nr:hypothetical protein [Pyxidicoccus fallax]NMO13586.1 hypothetical protein [Pyxidicoccus fallax]NPC76883.1 hypothetical protein [Pyxidicoccus fallax]
MRLRPSLWVIRAAALLAVCTGLSHTAADAQSAPHHAVSGSRFEYPADCAQSSDWEAAMRKATDTLLSRAGLTITCLPTTGEALRYDTPDERRALVVKAGPHSYRYDVRHQGTDEQRETFTVGGKVFRVEAPDDPFGGWLEDGHQAFELKRDNERYLVLANGLGSVSGSASRLRFFYIFPLDAKGRLRRAPIKTWATDFTHSLFGALNERGGVGFLALRRGSGPDNHRFKAEVFQLTPRGLEQTGTKKEFELAP